MTADIEINNTLQDSEIKHSIVKIICKNGVIM